MVIHKFNVGLTGGEVAEPIIRFVHSNHRYKLKNEVYRVLQSAGFQHIETTYFGPQYIPELCDFDHSFKSSIGDIIFREDESWEFDFILADSQPGVINKVADLLDQDNKFQLISE